MPNENVLVPAGRALAEIMTVAEGRVLDQLRREFPDTHDRELIRKALEIHETGALGEWAVAAHYGVPWVPAARGAVDIWPDIEVRTTRYSNGQLPHLRTDDPRHRYVLVQRHWAPGRGQALVAEVIGWIWGEECRQPCWEERERWPGWAVPRAALRNPGQLTIPEPPEWWLKDNA